MDSIVQDHPVLEKARRLARNLQNSQEISRFRIAERQVNESPTVQETIREIKRKQKELVHANHYGKTEYARMLRGELDRLNQKLDDLPIVREYRQAQVEVNDLLQTIQRVIADTVAKTVRVETGGDSPGGCGSGGSCGCGNRS
ncbi:RicAFT regulatory complex protein RicA family protein [Staphylospora marina]|uniref:RicAFT regulatory complex protein RicA family protein n=1 Tax=Staphylospora marina TaxID=2490858 RepID=UPI000F5B8D00|nr:YlbF family regulator [Staphylospora marina]